MRRRLVLSYLLLMVLVLAALEIPLAFTLATAETGRVRADRLADATRFSSLSGPALRVGATGPVSAELDRYAELYGLNAALVDRDRTVVLRTPRYRPDPALVESATRASLAGQQSAAPGLVWPWNPEPLVVSVPVSENGEVLGSLIISSPTNRIGRTTLSWWLVLAVIGMLAVLACVLTAFRLAGWVLRPITVLDAVTHEIAAGDRSARAPHRVGPPELRRLAASFNDMADALSDAMERQRAFVAHASHQLRNPLTALRLRVEELGPSVTDEDGRTEHRLALEESDRLAEVLDGLLTLARAERGADKMVVVDAAAVAISRVRAWQPLARRRSIQLNVSTPAIPAYASAAPTALDQSLDALIDNAVKFTDEGGKIDVSVYRLDGGVAIHVRDNGRGMTSAQLRHATERFWRAADAQNISGAGLGLTIVAVLVDVSGGRLTMRQAIPRGLDASLWFRVPDESS
ncbi:sensor histidine kinase [Micromonospora pisi]|uniref:sensor histidine kinase n=1 Tax=Micromonospora pisi TaxID=589240 RepID=UPI000EAECC97|nr:HAMP domain-containing sensor histidine kinase [Micromonospora pisi]